jgi:hypothetical protein
VLKVLVVLIWQLMCCLLFDYKNSQERPRATCFAKGQPGNAIGRTWRFHEPSHMGC